MSPNERYITSARYHTIITCHPPAGEGAMIAEEEFTWEASWATRRWPNLSSYLTYLRNLGYRVLNVNSVSQ